MDVDFVFDVEVWLFVVGGVSNILIDKFMVLLYFVSYFEIELGIFFFNIFDVIKFIGDVYVFFIENR